MMSRLLLSVVVLELAIACSGPDNSCADAGPGWVLECTENDAICLCSPPVKKNPQDIDADAGDAAPGEP